MCRIILVSLVSLAIGCCSRSTPMSEEPALAGQIIHLAMTINGSQDFDAAFLNQADELIRRVDDPNAVRKLVEAFRSYDHPIKHDGRCALCERIEDASSACLHWMSEIGTDAAARELVRLLADERMGWDGGASLTLGYCITRMGKIARPHLEAIMGDPRFDARTKQYIECIDRGAVYW